MDPAAKKQRRRSIRNLRKSTCFVPPSLNYGSAWVGENQDTNISNLVESMEDLQCQDDFQVENRHCQIGDIPQNIDRLNYDHEEACDGFQSVQPFAGESCIQHSLASSKGGATHLPIPKNGLCFRNISQSESISSPVNFPLPLSMSSEMPEGKSCCANTVFPQMNDQVTLVSHDYSKQPERKLFSEGIESFTKSRDTLIGTEQLDTADERNCDNINHTDNISNRDHSSNIGNDMNVELNNVGEFCSENINTVLYESGKLCQVDSAKSFPCQQENGTEYFINSQETSECNERPMVQHSDSGGSGTKGNDACGDIVEGEINRRSSGYRCQYNPNVSYDSLDDSMSPEFKDFDSCSGKLTESTHSIDLIDRAMTSFPDLSAFNMSFSPMDLRPDTPTSSSSVPCNNQSGDKSCPEQLRQSISDIICSLEDPIISSDPDTSLMVHNGGLALLVHNGGLALTDPDTSLMVHNDGLALTDPDTSLMVHNDGLALTDPDTSLIVHNGDLALTDPATSLMVQRVGMSSATTAAVLSPLPHDSHLAETVKELNTTYTLPSSPLSASNLHNETEGMADDCEETDCQRIELCNTIASFDVMDAEPMMIMDFDFKKSKSKCNKRRSSNFVKPKSIVKSHTIDNTTVSGIETSVSALDTGTKEYSMDTSPRMKETFHESTEFVTNTTSVQDIEIINSTDSNVIEQNIQMIEPGGNHLVFVQSTSQSPLSDCGNMLTSQGEVKAKKKTRRKSSKLTRLLEESERFLPESTSQELKARLQCGTGNKENEIFNADTEVEVSTTTDQRPSLSRRNLRTRPSRKSWDFRKDSQTSGNGGCSDASLGSVDSQNDSLSSELEDLLLVYGEQKYEAKSPQPLETVKESANEKAAFSKQRVKRYLKFGSVSVPKGKKRMKKALNVYRGRQCFIPVTDQEFERKMLDVQLLLDFDLQFSI